MIIEEIPISIIALEIILSTKKTIKTKILLDKAVIKQLILKKKNNQDHRKILKMRISKSRK